MTDCDLLLSDCEKPTCVGSGLLALDVVFNTESPDNYLARSGGSCGNVMSILAYLGWRARPVARLGQDHAAKIILDDLARFGVDTEFISQECEVDTPLVLERIRKSLNGRRQHSFKLSCPICGRNLLKYRAITIGMAGNLLRAETPSQVFYFDRISRGILNIAWYYRKVGSLIVFEPSGIQNEKLFKEALELVHILKYSAQRFSDMSGILGNGIVPLEVQTLGSEGLRYRYSPEGQPCASWKKVPALKVGNIVDDAGAGDWCTAGLIHSLGREGATTFKAKFGYSLVKAFDLGQALAALSCQYASPRGAMYSLSPQEIQEAVRKMSSLKGPDVVMDAPLYGTFREFFESVCGSCNQYV